ncbi:MAG TPA: hypothetical protein VJR04_06130 [Terriglobales bacterium]|nr:hypothetical protein [Terriglobales bacterium]
MISGSGGLRCSGKKRVATAIRQYLMCSIARRFDAYQTLYRWNSGPTWFVGVFGWAQRRRASICTSNTLGEWDERKYLHHIAQSTALFYKQQVSTTTGRNAIPSINTWIGWA